MASKKGIRWLSFTFLGSFLAGGLFFCFDTYDLFSLNGYTLEAPNAAIERRFWDLFPPECLRYWPTFMMKSSQIGMLLERTIPVEVETRPNGVGTFHTKITYLQPWLHVEWLDHRWFVSQSGMMWNPSLSGLKAPEGPLWILPDNFVKYNYFVKIDDMPDGVFPVMFSMEMLQSFVGVFNKLPWLKNIGEVKIEKRSGDYLMKVSLGFGSQKAVIVGQADGEKWREAETAIAQIIPQLKKEAGNFVVDMTYSNKIVVTRDVQEGSSK